MSALIDLTGTPASPASSPSTPPPAPPATPRLTRGAVGGPLPASFTPPVIPGLDSQSEWDLHHNAVRSFYTPEGYLEDACAFRIASLLWRLNRLVRAETDHLAQSLADAEADAASIVADESVEPMHIRPILPVSVADLRRCSKDAKLAAKVLAEFHQWPTHDPISDAHADAAYSFLAAFYSHSPDNPPADRPPDGWTGTRLRSSLSKLAVNRSIYDDISPVTAFSNEVAAAADRRLTQIETLTARLRRERAVPHSPLGVHIREGESALGAQLEREIRQLDLLQARRSGLPVTG